MLLDCKISEFIYIMLMHADDKDVYNFINCCDKRLHITKNDYASSKKILINYLFGYIYTYIEGSVQDILHFRTNDNEELLYMQEPSDYLNRYRTLYLHLYALCENYYSYILVNDKEKNNLMAIKLAYETTLQDEYCVNKEFPPTKEIHSTKENSPNKLLKLLINNYVKNGFYYVFHDNILEKICITKHMKSQGYDDKNKSAYSLSTATYDYTKYNLIDKNKITFIVNNKIKINESLGKYLERRQTITEEIPNGLDIIKENCKSHSMDDVRYFHKKIVETLKIDNSEKISLQCTESVLQKFRKKCDVLLQKLKELQDIIIYDEPNDYILTIRDNDFEKILFSFEKQEINNLKQLKEQNKKYLNGMIKEIKKQIKEEDDYDSYKEIDKVVDEIEKLIPKCHR